MSQYDTVACHPKETMSWSDRGEIEGSTVVITHDPRVAWYSSVRYICSNLQM